jgi:hypothetical protein
MALFGAGSIVGMATLSGLWGWPLARLARRPRVGAAVAALVGLLSTGLGIAWGWPLAGRLFGAAG